MKISILQARPPAFTYRSGILSSRSTSLHCESLSIIRLAKQFGTPLYIYSGSTIRERYAAFEKAFAGIPHTVCYSVKANSNISILRLLRREGAGFDVVSGGELQRVILTGKKSAASVVFSGVGKSDAEIDLALDAGILMFNAESESELRAIANRAARYGKRAQVALRVNPDVPAETHPYISTGLHKHKFGIPVEVARTLYRSASRNRHLEVVGVSAHIGSQITDVSPFREAVTRLADLVRDLRSEGIPIRYLDAGGGLGIPYHESSGMADFANHAAAYARALTEPLAGLGLHLLLEPGRAIIGPCGVLVTRITYEKTNNGKRFLVVDAGMNDLIRPSLYGAHHEIVPVSPSGSRKQLPYDVVGPICETGDFFARDRDLPPVKEGDLLAILDAGAYGMSLASNYNTRVRPAEVLVEGRKSRLIRRRETFKDMLRNEI